MLKNRILKLIGRSANHQHCVALAERLLKQRAQDLNRQTYTPSPFFMAKLTARLRAEAEPFVMTWEHAVPALRGWLLTFSATALLLVAAAFTLTFDAQQPEENIFTASASDTTQHDAFWTGD